MDDAEMSTQNRADYPFPQPRMNMDDEISRLDARAAEISHRYDRLKEALDAKTMTVTSDNGLVSVQITGSGDILGLSVSPEAMRDPHVHRLGSSIAATINTARARARKLRSTAIAKAFPNEPEVAGTAPRSAEAK